ncbi:MAG: PAS domain S-box protein [Planctomycetaceae bacterium]|nr:PAS domain S-box protein [Planctomycetaceae bacterium]
MSNFLASIVESSDDAIASKTLDGIVTSWNRAAERIFGYTAAEMIGRPISVLAVPGNTEDMAGILEKIARGERVDHYDTIRRAKDGRLVHISLCVSPIRDATGKIVGASKIARDISDRKRIEKEKEALLQEIRKQVKQRDEFLEMLAHELRNPLAPLRNAVHLLEVQGDDAASVSMIRGMMERQIVHLSRLIDDLLDVARITQGKLRLKEERIDLCQLAREDAEDHQGLFQKAGVTIVTRLQETPVWVHGDRARLTQILDNFLENACKFVKRGGKTEIEVTSDLTNQQAILRVRDNGIGIESELLPRVFELFTQADRGLDRSRGGLGIGLAVVKRLAELHRGEVEAHSDGLGKGAEFTVRLPLAGEPSAIILEFPTAQKAARSMRILVVEDNRDSAESLRRLLTIYGYDVSLAYTGAEGVETAQRAHPDVVICDIGLPGMDGYAVAKAIRKNPGTASTRLIAVTGYGQESDRLRALASGFDSHLVKPADPRVLLDMLA